MAHTPPGKPVVNVPPAASAAAWARVRRFLVAATVTAVILFLTWVPLSFLLYGGAGGGIGGLIILAPILVLQYPLVMMFRRLVPRPPERNEDEA